MSMWAPKGYFMCCICFDILPEDKAFVDSEGTKWDLCSPDCADQAGTS